MSSDSGVLREVRERKKIKRKRRRGREKGEREGERREPPTPPPRCFSFSHLSALSLQSERLEQASEWFVGKTI